MIEAPEVIFLDAVGTIFGVRGSVGETYRSIAANFGVETSADALNTAFKRAFSTSPPLAFPQAKLAQISALEFQWWREVVKETFTIAGVIEVFFDFDRFFRELYEHFATASPWYVYPDVVPFLTKWQKKGKQLSVISNFDSRIERVIAELELTQYFSSITISPQVGAAKPDSKIFLAALEKHAQKAERAWHIGDNLKEDYYGAKAVGIRPFLLQRSILREIDTEQTR